jgi:hypothetical protein
MAKSQRGVAMIIPLRALGSYSERARRHPSGLTQRTSVKYNGKDARGTKAIHDPHLGL